MPATARSSAAHSVNLLQPRSSVRLLDVKGRTAGASIINRRFRLSCAAQCARSWRRATASSSVGKRTPHRPRDHQARADDPARGPAAAGHPRSPDCNARSQSAGRRAAGNAQQGHPRQGGRSTSRGPAKPPPGIRIPHARRALPAPATSSWADKRPATTKPAPPGGQQAQHQQPTDGESAAAWVRPCGWPPRPKRDNDAQHQVHQKTSCQADAQQPGQDRAESCLPPLRPVLCACVRIFFSNSSSRAVSYWPTASTSDEISRSPETCGEARKPATKSPARFCSHSRRVQRGAYKKRPLRFCAAPAGLS